ncbi:MAG TPA: ATP phosphoribosyltransferase regulatory subunit [Candidatus Nanoarchaeia archaeon]|nr:ATP phosphoribosyltransferase regulatory subunit [Candidatus Nanoarchaeia archaeon]
MTSEPVKGFRDFAGKEAKKLSEIQKILVTIFERYGFEPSETPIIEYEDFVKGENKEDEAVSDIFKLKDKGKRNLALRYEFTFQLKRLMQNKKLPYKRFQIGPVFRDEPTKENRLRQFTQADVDVVNSSIKDEAEILSLSNDVLKNLGIEPIILFNNRKLLDEILDDLKIKEKYRNQVLREIDKFGKIPESEIAENLKKFGAEKFFDSVKQGEEYFNKFESYKEVIGLIEYCRAYGLKIFFSPTVIRGLSYYNGSVFEIKTKGIRETLVGGGSYKFNNVQCTGISFGLERISAIAKLKKEDEKFLVISLNQDRKSIALAQQLRRKGKVVSLFYGKPSKALEYANAYGFGKVIFVGGKEVKLRRFRVKIMKTGKEIVLKI